MTWLSGLTGALGKWRTELVLAGVALILYLPGIGWGLPYATDAIRTHGWATDAVTPLEPLSQVHNLIQPKPDRWLPYPLMHHFLLTAVYAPYLLFLWITGGLSNPSPVYPFGLADPVGALQTLELLGKAVTLCMAIGIIVAVYRTGSILWGQTAGKLAAVFTMLMFPMFYYSRTGNADVPVLFWTALGVMTFARMLRDQVTTKRAVEIGIFAAFAIATKDQAWGAFVLIAPVLLAVHVYQSRRAGAPISTRPLVVGFLASSIAYALASGLAISPERHFAHIEWVRTHIPWPEQESFPATPAGYAGLVVQTLGHVSDATGAAMLLAAAVGVALAWRSNPLTVAVLVPALGHFLLVLVPIRMSLLRYVLPIAMIACLFAGRALAAGLASSGRRKLLSLTAVTVIVAWLAVLGGDLTYQMLHDSHYEAATWLDQHMKEGEQVATVAATACLPRLKPGVHYLVLDKASSPGEQIGEHRPEWVIIMPDWTSPKGGLYPRAFPEEAHQRLVDGSLGYRRAARFKTESLVTRQILDYPTVNPPIEIFVRDDLLTSSPW